MPIAHNIKEIDHKITTACRQWKRDPNTITCVAVSKKQPMERVLEALESGHRVFGETIVQEAKETWRTSGLKEQYSDVRLHLIGALQRNKAKEAVALFDCIESVDRPSLVDVLVKEMEAQKKRCECFIQVNTGEEEQKAGVLPAALPALLDYARSSGLNITGLMAIPPHHEPSALHFAFLKKLAKDNGLSSLSMGMSADFEHALALGATHLRIGTALFGERPSVKDFL